MSKQEAPRAKSGGGIGMRHVTHVTAPKTEPRSHSVDPGRASQIGQSTAFAKAPLYGGRGYSPPVGPTNNLAQGPGAGREVLRSGSQSAVPAAIPMTGDKAQWPDKR